MPGLAEVYLLTGRHGFFSCDEAFIHIIDFMFNQHAKWLKVCNEIPWRPDRVPQLSAVERCLAPGPQRLEPPGSGLHRSRRQQEGGSRARRSTTRCQLPAFGHRPLRAQPEYVNVIVAGSSRPRNG